MRVLVTTNKMNANKKTHGSDTTNIMTELITGKVYLRDNPWYALEQVIKLGIAANAKDRSNTYITGEVERGKYIWVVEIPLDKLHIIDKCLKQHFKSLHVYKGGGTEFYDRSIIDLIESYFAQLGVPHKVLTKDEIDQMHWSERVRELVRNMPHKDKVKQVLDQMDVANMIRQYRLKRLNKCAITPPTNAQITPTSHQQQVLDRIGEFYSAVDVGKLVWACGLGKALIGILIVQLLQFKSVAIGVPSNQLQQQLVHEILRVFPNRDNILLVGGVGIGLSVGSGTHDNGRITTATDKKQVMAFLSSGIDCGQPKFIITTYHSCYMLVDADIAFDFKVGDEAHHLVGMECDENRGFRLFHKIKSSKTLFMTATEKTLDIDTDINKTCNSTNNNSRTIYSMNDETVFGPYIDVKSVHWAIENKKITDYNVLVLKNTENEVDDIIAGLKLNVQNKELFISCYMCLKSFEKYGDLTHLLLYTNTTAEAELAATYMDDMLSLNVIAIPKDSVYNKALHSKNCTDLFSEVNAFKTASHGIISCVYIFGEGFDLPKLTGVCIAGNMQSETRIVQYLLRPNRLNADNPNKIAYIIIPYIDTDNWLTEHKSFDKVKTIVAHLRNVDEQIEQKIMVSVRTKEPIADNNNGVNEDEDNDDPHNVAAKEPTTVGSDGYIFEDNIGALNNIKLRLRYSKTLASNFTEEQDEYNYVRAINTSLNIASKKEYVASQSVHSQFVAAPEDYFKSKGVWTDWYDFMGTDTTQFIQSKQEWINYCRQKGINSLEDYNRSCEFHAVLPKEPADFYRDFTNIAAELSGISGRRL